MAAHRPDRQTRLFRYQGGPRTALGRPAPIPGYQGIIPQERIRIHETRDPPGLAAACRRFTGRRANPTGEIASEMLMQHIPMAGCLYRYEDKNHRLYGFDDAHSLMGTAVICCKSRCLYRPFFGNKEFQWRCTGGTKRQDPLS